MADRISKLDGLSDDEDEIQQQQLQREISFLDHSAVALNAWEALKEHTAVYALPLLNRCSFSEFLEATCRKYTKPDA